MKVNKLKQQGFTIVELLIVIVIIGILATIGFVSFSSAQNKAKKSKATSTVAQVKSKLGEYYADNNYYPATKAEVVTYLNDNGGASTSTEFDGSASYTYTATPSGCTVAAKTCTSYTITAAKAYWNGGESETNVTAAP